MAERSNANIANSIRKVIDRMNSEGIENTKPLEFAVGFIERYDKGIQSYYRENRKYPLGLALLVRGSNLAAYIVPAALVSDNGALRAYTYFQKIKHTLPLHELIARDMLKKGAKRGKTYDDDEDDKRVMISIDKLNTNTDDD